MKVKLANKDIRENYVFELLKEYGVENIGTYLNPPDSVLQTPKDLFNIDRGYVLYNEVCSRKGKILLIVDSDVDGFTSSAMFYLYTKEKWPEVTIDYRLHSGKQHGLEDHIDWIEENAIYDLVVCPDSSSNDYDYHERLKILGIPVLVLDHHLTDVDISNNAVVINNQLSANYDNKDLTGAGVVYQFCRYLDEMYGVEYADKYVDLAALGIDGDMGSLLSIENRYLMTKGFNNINNFFFNTLIDKQSFSMGGKITPISVAFYIVPLINAMIRVGESAEKDRLFRAFINGTELVPSNKRGAKGQMEMVAVESARECTNAKAHQSKDMDNAVTQLETKIFENNLLNNKILFIRLEDEDFRPEINGLLAMKLAAKYKKPTIVARMNAEGYDKGSIRGLNNSGLTSFKDFLTESGLCEYVQGHDNAAGISIEDRNLRALHEYANEKLKDINFNESCYSANFQRNCFENDIKDIIIDITNYPNIWGTGLPEPMIYITGIKVKPNDVQIMGRNKDTIKIINNGIAYMKFFGKEMIEELNKYEGPFVLDVIGKANMNEWMGNYTPQIFIENYEIKSIKEDLLTF